MKQNTSSNTGHEFKFKKIAKVWNLFVIFYNNFVNILSCCKFGIILKKFIISGV